MRHVRYTMARMALPIGLALALLGSVSPADENWHTQWRRVRLNAAQEAKAKADLKTIIEWPGTEKFHADELAKTVKTNRYEPLDFEDKKYGERYEPLCRLEATQLLNKGERDPKRPPTINSYICSCAFLSSEVLVTAAHCFFPPAYYGWGTPAKTGQPADTRPGKGWLLYVVQAYGSEAKGKGKYVEHLRKQAQVLVEWWTPAKFTGNEADINKNRHADVAFAKVRNEMGNELQRDRAVYAFKTPEGKLKTGPKYNMFDDNVLLMHLGYPVAYKTSERAVQITGKIMRYKETDEDRGVLAFFGQATKGIKKENVVKSLLSSNKKKEADASTVIVGNMGVGGSGGPLIVRNEDASEELWMAMFGVVSTCVRDSEGDPKRRCDAARIEPDMVEAAKQISKLDLGLVAPQTVEGIAKAISTADASTEKVELELPKAAARAVKKNNSR